MKTVGVIGGMGPAATVDFMQQLVAATPAQRDQDHLHVIVDSDPTVPDRTAAILREGPDPSPWLRGMAERLERAGAELLVMPCNSAHYFASAITSAVAVPLVDWPAVVADAVAAQGLNKAGLLATTGTVDGGVYIKPFEAAGLRLVAPEPALQAIVMGAIEEVKQSGLSSDSPRRAVEEAVSRLVDVEGIVLACTELSLINSARQLVVRDGIHVLDASQIVASHVVALALA